MNTVRSRAPFENGFRTPAIEDDDHPLNLWRSEQENNRTIDSYFSPQHQAIEDHFQRIRTHENTGRSEVERKTKRLNTHGKHLSWRDRVKHTTWAFFTFTMATGGLANVLHSVPFEARWVYNIGLIFFFLNIIAYITIWAMILTRFISYPKTFLASLVHPTESLFVPAFAVSFGTICITIVEYGANNTGEWLTHAVLVLFWFNAALAITLSITIYMILWSSLTFTIAQMTPIWIFPAYPLLIIGPHAANLSAKLPSELQALEVIVGGFTVQGIGFLVSLTIYSAFVYRLMTQKLPAEPLRPGMFVSVGPAAFTCSGTIGMAQNLERAISSRDVFMGVSPALAAQILRLVGNWVCLWLWGLAFWFFFVSVISNLAPLYTHNRLKKEVIDDRHEKHRNSIAFHGCRYEIQHERIPFAMTWYSYIFPQTALSTATFRVAIAFDLHALKVVGCVMTGLLVAMWLFVGVMMIRAIRLKQILWPEKGEDREEGGFRRPMTAKRTSDDIESQSRGAVAGELDVTTVEQSELENPDQTPAGHQSRQS